MSLETLALTKADFQKQLQQELTGNILPFWLKYAPDPVNGGFYGAVTNDLQVLNEVPRSAVLCARILWTYATAYRQLGDERYLTMARQAYDYLTRVFWDHGNGGVYWSVNAQGQPVSDHKHDYAQGFTIYGLSEYYRATQEPQSLQLAQTLFNLLETHAYEPVYGGYLEGRSRTWGTLNDMSLSNKDLNCSKSMNTLLHILEAYTNLLRIWPEAKLKAQHRALIDIFHQQVIDPDTHHFKLFFDDQWHSLLNHVSYGHDIEGSWLLLEAAEVQGDETLIAQVRETATHMATAVYQEGLDADGSLFNENTPEGLLDTAKAWWVQAEGMVGFYNAYQVSGQLRFAQAAIRCWEYIQNKLVDRTHGDWFKEIKPDGQPDAHHFKIGPWDCPYHHSRACLEMLERLEHSR
ncbi:MAG TPA: AGE family epimerase/isomerase [Phototrophicaceae bacterium]|nr:AGE family epimerase/isomerase [Phototrophicaceae bacterium]